jgi:hypothetical protein
MSFFDRIFSQPITARRFALLRISLGLIIAVLVTFGPYGSFYTNTAAFLYEPGPLLPFLPALSPSLFYLLRALVVFSSILFAGGWLLRWMAPLTALSFFVFNYYVSCFAGAQWSYNVHLNLFLFLWWISLKKKDSTEFVVGFMQLYVAMLYFQTGLSKLMHGGLRWFTEGETIYTNALLLGGERGAFFAQYEWLFPLAGIATALFELGFLPAYLLGFRRLLCVAGVLFHLGIFLMLGISFWHMWLLYPALFWMNRVDHGSDKDKDLHRATPE